MVALIIAAVVVVLLVVLFVWREMRFASHVALPLPADVTARSTPRLGRKRRTDVPLTVVVFGGAGNIGSLVVHELHSLPNVSVVVADMVAPKQQLAGVAFRKCNITDYASVVAASRGCDAAVHLASVIDLRSTQHHQARMHNINIVGTHNVINACVANGLTALVYTGSTAARYQGVQPREAHAEVEDEKGENRIFLVPPPNPDTFLYGYTKHMAEKAVLRANGRGGLRTVVLTPHAVIGARDIIYLEARARALVSGAFTPRLATADMVGVYGFSYNRDVARGHVLALHALLDDSKCANVQGHTFFLISENCSAVQFESNFIKAVEKKTVHRSTGPDQVLVGLPLTLLTGVATFLDWFTKGTSSMRLLQLTPGTLAVVRGEHTYNCDKAKRVLGFAPTPLDAVVEEIVDEMIADGLLTASKHGAK